MPRDPGLSEVGHIENKTEEKGRCSDYYAKNKRVVFCCGNPFRTLWHADSLFFYFNIGVFLFELFKLGMFFCRKIRVRNQFPCPGCVCRNCICFGDICCSHTSLFSRGMCESRGVLIVICGSSYTINILTYEKSDLFNCSESHT